MEESDDIHIPCSSVSAEPGDSYESDPDTPPRKKKVITLHSKMNG